MGTAAIDPAEEIRPIGHDETEAGSRRLADMAVGALLAEAELTPKPGLVDRRGGGAHGDMDLALMRRSAEVLGPTFAAMARVAWGRPADQGLREELGHIGRAGEGMMLTATGGRNTHRGAIWSLGLLIGGAALTSRSNRLPSDRWAAAQRLAAAAAQLARIPDRRRVRGESHGVRMERRYGARGAAGEAEAGFPHVVKFGLPTLWSARARGVGESCARLDGLLAIMAELDDTCLLRRGGLDALTAAQMGARTVLQAGGSASAAGAKALARLDGELIARWASPGGSADLLAATLFVDGWTRGPALP